MSGTRPRVLADIAGPALAAALVEQGIMEIADLAGAEPVPLQGCEKFVLKFPQKVLANFIDSLSVVWTLSETKNETQVLVDYFVWRWNNHDPSLGLAPTGQGAIAKMRLVLMAQGDSLDLLEQFKNLDVESRLLLGEEMALTGAAGQNPPPVL